MALAALAGFLAIVIHLPARAQNEGVTVFAAASLKTALDDVAAQWRKQTGKTARIS
jgi:molybdate transport system substrate-binding protein